MHFTNIYLFLLCFSLRLRNLSQPSDGGIGGNMSGVQMGTMSTGPRYLLAEHRYGREEMLALFNSTSRTLDALHAFPMLVVEKPQPPLALIPMTEDETVSTT
jgi:PERQ amino acid-rich with GYF domain-containing protein